ncbi:MAG: hypothetical protein L0338_39690 [Acidobacteria bacterium]|nr:hypothetical protein [Acidobacteriota bacterium]
MAIYREVFNLAQRFLGDPSGIKVKEGSLFPLIVEALHQCQRRLSEEGHQVLRGIQEVQLPANTTAIGLTTTPALNADFVVPYELEEKIGGTTGKYTEMDKDERLLPDVDRTERLRLWNFRGNQILFIGSTRPVDIRISYEKELPAPAFLTDTVPIIGATGAIAYYSAYLYGGQQKHMDGYEEAILGVISPEVRANQFKQVRRIPYRYRSDWIR